MLRGGSSYIKMVSSRHPRYWRCRITKSSVYHDTVVLWWKRFRFLLQLSLQKLGFSDKCGRKTLTCCCFFLMQGLFPYWVRIFSAQQFLMLTFPLKKKVGSSHNRMFYVVNRNQPLSEHEIEVQKFYEPLSPRPVKNAQAWFCNYKIVNYVVRLFVQWSTVHPLRVNICHIYISSQRITNSFNDFGIYILKDGDFL